jgi:HAD superfamily hydrolase (TIGR01490 family)
VKKRLVLFDFDGTITTKDTFIEFILFYHGRYKFAAGFGLMLPILVLYKLKLIANWKAKEIVLAWFFKGEEVTKFDKICLDFTSTVLPSLIRPKALQEINQYKAEKAAELVVVSASAENWVSPWCKANDIRVIATKLESVQGKLTGKLKGRNCFGEEKAIRVRNRYNLSEFEEVIAYGDSSGDKEMLALANKHFYKPFRD